MGIFDNFLTPAKPAQPAQAPAQGQQPDQQAPAGNIQDPATVAANSNVADQPPAAPAEGSAQDTVDNNPLAQFADLWDTKPTDPAQSAQPQELSQEAVAKSMAKVNFSNAISPDQLAAIGEGGEAAQQAFAQALNSVAQQVMVQSTLINNKLTDQAVQQALEAQKAQLPSLLRQQAAADHLKTTNPLFSNPAVKPVMEATQQQLLAKYPNATQAELTQMTQDYITAMGEAFAPKAPVNNNEGNEPDWSTFLN